MRDTRDATDGAATPTRRAALHVLLSIQSLTIVALSVNRLSHLTVEFVASNEFLRWVDLNNMVLGLVAVVLTYLTYQHLLASTDGRHAARRILDLTFVLGAYLYAVSYGSHEITNYLHGRFCPDATDNLCRIVAFNDDEFSHYLFFAGFLLLNLVVMFAQVTAPDRAGLRVVDWWLLTVNALFVGAGVVANLAFEEIGLDLYVIMVVAVISVILLWRHGCNRSSTTTPSRSYSDWWLPRSSS